MYFRFKGANLSKFLIVICTLVTIVGAKTPWADSNNVDSMVERELADLYDSGEFNKLYIRLVEEAEKGDLLALNRLALLLSSPNVNVSSEKLSLRHIRALEIYKYLSLKKDPLAYEMLEKAYRSGSLGLEKNELVSKCWANAISGIEHHMNCYNQSRELHSLKVPSIVLRGNR